MGEMALDVLAYIVENPAGMKFPTINSRAKILVTDKSALTLGTDRPIFDVDQIENEKNKKYQK